MKKIITLAALCCLPFGFAQADEADMKARADKSKAAIAEFSSNLKGQLEAAMKEGGPVKAITVCNTVAPALAKETSDKYQMTIGRTSLKVRNSKNAPDAWETKVLKSFE